MYRNRYEELKALFPAYVAMTSAMDGQDHIYAVYPRSHVTTLVARVDRGCVPVTIGTRALLDCIRDGKARPCSPLLH